MKESVNDPSTQDIPFGDTFTDAINETMEEFKSFHYWRGIKKFSQPISRLMVEKIFRRFRSLESILTDHKLKPRQKGLEIALKVFGALAFVPVVLGALIGGTALIPSMMLLCSSLETIKNFMFWRAEKAERNILRQEMVTTAELETQIDQSGLNDFEKMVVRDFTFREAQIYADLYQMRQNIITDVNQSFEQKQTQVAIVNSAIEAFSKNKLESLDFSALSVPLDEQKSFSLALSAYNFAQEKMKGSDIKLNKSLKDTINLYKMSRAEIFSQDIPESIKSKMVAMVERKKNTIDDVRDLQVRLVNHYINISHLQKDSASEIEKYPTPQINPIDDRRHVLDVAQNKVKTTLEKYAFNFIGKKTESIPEQVSTAQTQQEATIAEFKKHGFNVKTIEDKLRLEHLEKATPKRLINAWLTFSGAVMHAAVVAIPVMLITAGPGAAALGAGLVTFLSGTSVAVGVASYTGALVLNHQDSQRMEKLKSLQKNSEQASYEMSHEEVQAYKKMYEKKPAKESKIDIFSNKVKAFLPGKMGLSAKKTHLDKTQKTPDITATKGNKPNMRSK